MRILLFHPVLLPAQKYGGVERVVLWLAQGLIERGHEVWVAALDGSSLPKGAKLVVMEPEHVSASDLLKKLPKGIDVIHCMAPPEKEMQSEGRAPWLVTVHGNGKKGENFPRNSVFLSQDHAKRHGASVFVHNGIDPSECLFDPKSKRDHFLFLSKTSWRVKNLRGAMRLCSQAGASLRICGGNRPWDLRLKAAFSRRLKWVGSVGGKQKAQELAQAKGLIFPVIWDEPFGLVVAEALMSGTPVIAAKRGSLPELITSDVGALCETDEQWLDWLSREQLPWAPEACREYAMRRFHYRKMAESYERIYVKVMSGSFLHEKHPMTQGESS